MFCHLHIHSCYSFYAGVCTIEELVERAVQLGLSCLALTDTNRMSGLITFYTQCLRAGIHPILGTQLTAADNPHEYALLLAKNLTGYGDLCELLSARHCARDTFSLQQALCRPRPDLFMITPSVRLLCALAKSPNRDNLYAELINQHAASRRSSRTLLRYARACGIPAVVTNPAWFAHARQWHLHTVLRAIGMNTSVSRLAARDMASKKAWIKPPAQMRALFPSQHDALAASQRIAAQCCVEFEFNAWKLPRISPPHGDSIESYLHEIAMRGLEHNYGGMPEYDRARRIQEKELRVITSMGYASYFVMVKEIREWANRRLSAGFRSLRDCTIMRGSAANSITFYNIGASDLDPIRHDLYFERFLNEDRASPPDADLDFGWDERNAVIDYVFRRWGASHVAVLCTIVHFKRRAAFRETAKVLGFSDAQISLYMQGKKAFDERELERIGHIARRIEGMPRFLGQHCGGVIITDTPIYRHVALQRCGGLKNRCITQIDMHQGIDELGLIKFDLLGNGSLSVLRDTLTQLHAQGYDDPRVYDEERVHNDAPTRRGIREGDTRGIFYIESPAQIRLNRNAQAFTFEDVGITSSLVRPAGTQFTKLFVQRNREMRQGKKSWHFLHPSLEPILGQTHGCLVFQEHIIRICHEIAGMSFAQADRVRKMMNSLHEGTLHTTQYRETARAFIHGCMRGHGFSQTQALRLWEGISSFTGFSFCKSHSLSYARLSFQCTYLKMHYPAQFMAAVISNGHGFYTTDVYLNEARRLGVRILPLDIHKSEIRYVGFDTCIRPGLMHIKHFGQRAHARIEAYKTRYGRFRCLSDLIHHTGLSIPEIEGLILCGACDGFGLSHPQLLSRLYSATSNTVPAAGSRIPHLQHVDACAHLPDYTLAHRCLNELHYLGFMISGDIRAMLDMHPAACGCVGAGHIEAHVNGRVRVFARAITARVHRVQGKKKMCFITVEDMSGICDVILWPQVYTRVARMLQHPGPYVIEGTVRREWDCCTLEAATLRAVSWEPNIVDFTRASQRLREMAQRYHSFHEPGAHTHAA